MKELRSGRCYRFLLAGATALMVCGAAQAQEQARQRNERAAASGASLTLPAGENLLELRVEGAQQARVGERFNYQIHVRNLSDNVMLHDVKIAQSGGEGFSIESSQIQSGQQQPSQRREQGQAQSGAKPQSQQSKEKNESPRQSQDTQSGAKQADDRNAWTIDKLGPGQTRTISVEAASDKEGRSTMCLAVVSYTPALCIVTEFVKPDLELVKTVPEAAGLCEEIEFSYYVKNTGSGEARTFTIVDELGEGLQTVSGEPKLSFQVDGIKPGDTRKFVAKLRAKKPGEFSSRAVARQGEQVLARSPEATVQVRQAELAVAIDGPRAEEINKPLYYTIRVTNTGESVAPDVQLTLGHGAAQLVRAGEPQRSDRAVERSQQSSGSPTPASREASSQRRQSSSDQERESPQSAQRQSQENRQPGEQEANRNQGQNRQRNQASRQGSQEQSERASHSWRLGDLQPGETRSVSVILRGREGGEARLRAVAEFVCGVDRERQRISTVAMRRTEIIALPALHLSVVDNEDPVEVGKEVTYTILVVNEGASIDRNIQVTAQAPEGAEVVSADGQTDGKVSGREISFEPVEQLEPGQKAVWRVRLKPEADEQIVFQATLDSEGLSKEATSEEPTRFYKK